MNYENFAYDMMGDITEKLSQLYGPVESTMTSISKLQGASYDGASFKPEGKMIGATVNLREAFREVEAGVQYSVVCDRICESLVEALNNTPQIDVDELLNYDSVKSHLTMQIVSTEYNADKLADVPHKEIQDMSIVYRIDLGETTRGGEISTLVTNSLMKAFNVTTDQLHQDALENAPKLHPMEITPLRSYLSQNYGFDDMMPVPPDVPELLIASNEEKVNGASVIAYPNFFEEAAKVAGGDFFILPSSIHELLLIRDAGQFTPQELEAMVTEINADVVDPTEQLTNNVYRYDTNLHVLETGRQFLHRMAEQERPSILADLQAKAQEVKPPVPGRNAPEKTDLTL